MNSSLQFILLISIVIAAAKLGGLFSRKVRQPAVVGELLMGVLLGPSLLDLTHRAFISDSSVEESVFRLAEIGVIFLMFIVGLEIDADEFYKARKVAFWTGVCGVILTLPMGSAVARGFGFSFTESLFVGVTMTATSVTISARTLMDLSKLRTKEGIALLGAAVIDDVIGVLALSFFVAFTATGLSRAGNFAAVLWIITRMLLYFGIAGLAGVTIVPFVLAHAARLAEREGLLTAVIVLVLMYSFAAEQWGGMAAVTGAFLIGLILSRDPVKQSIERSIHALTHGFFVPIFFVSVGLKANVRELGGNLLWFTVSICLVAIISKIVGCGLGSRLAGMDKLGALRVGIGMISRGEIQLIVASIGLHEHILQRDVFSSVVLMVLCTTLIAPILLRWSFARPISPIAKH